MDNGSGAEVLPHEWDSQSLLLKARLFAEVMQEHPKDDWRYVLWSTFVLELLSRCVLSGFSRVLLADSNDWNNLIYSIGIEPKAKKFQPKSVPVTVVFKRLHVLVPEFTAELEGFCAGHMARRNNELHSGSAPMVSIQTSAWLPTYFKACAVLLAASGEDLASLFGKDEASVARQMIAAADDKSAKAVMKSVQAHVTVWKAKDQSEQQQLRAKAEVWASRHDGHRVDCPACMSSGVLIGSPISAPIQSINGDEISETQQYLPERFECIACGLRVGGFSQLNAIGLGDTYKATFTYDAADYYTPDDVYGEFEPDFNEP